MPTPFFSLVFWVLAHLFGPVEQTDPPLDDADTVAMLKASYLFKFASSNDWPADVKQGPFKIAVIGNNNVYRELLTKYATKPIGSQALEVYLLETTTSSDFYHVVYVSGNRADDLAKLAKATSGRPSLLVGDGKQSVGNGAAIGFVVVDNTTRYVINPDAAQRRKISIGSTILLWSVSN